MLFEKRNDLSSLHFGFYTHQFEAGVIEQSAASNPYFLVKSGEHILNIGKIRQPYCVWLWETCRAANSISGYKDSHERSLFYVFDGKTIQLQSAIRGHDSWLSLVSFSVLDSKIGLGSSELGPIGLFKTEAKQLSFSSWVFSAGYQLQFNYFQKEADFQVDIRKRQNTIIRLAAARYHRLSMNLFSFSESEGVYALMYTFASGRLRVLWDYESGNAIQLGFEQVYQGWSVFSEGGYGFRSLWVGIGARIAQFQLTVYQFQQPLQQSTTLIFNLWNQRKLDIVKRHYSPGETYIAAHYGFPYLSAELIMNQSLDAFYLKFKAHAL